jgi:hypothetical protein
MRATLIARLARPAGPNLPLSWPQRNRFWVAKIKGCWQLADWAPRGTISRLRRERMIKHAFSSAVHTNPGPARKPAVCGLMSALSLAGLLLLGGCNKTPAPAPDTAQSTPPAAPAPAAPAEPAAAAPAPAPGPSAAAAPPPPGSAMTGPAMAMTAAPPAAPRPITVPSGTPIVVRMGQTVSAKENSVGDSFGGTLAQSVVVHGTTIFRAGAPVTGVVTASKGQGRFKGDGALGISVRRIGNYEVTTSAYEKSVSGKGKRTAIFAGGGGGAGALIGGLAGGGKGALIGGLLGAGGGTAAGAFTGNKNVSVPAESVVTFDLAAPITVTRE